MSILLLLLILLFGLVGGGGYTSEPGLIEPTIEEAPPLPPPPPGAADETVATPRADAKPAVVREAWRNPDVIVDVATVDALMGEPTTKVVALTPMKEFVAGRIPGAVQVDWPALEIVETGDQQVETWRADVEQIPTSLFIAPTDTVVIYDGGTFYASRLWWVLDQLGHENKLILDGGLPAWQATGMRIATGFPDESDTPADPDGPYVGEPDDTTIATIAEVEVALADPKVVLVDARTPEEFAAGHIPGAVNIPFTDNAVDGSGGLWKSPEELRAMYEAAGVEREMTVIPYCLTGVRSAATYVTLTALGYPDVSLFTGSWAEWSADPERPVEV